MARQRRPGFHAQDHDGPGLTFLLVALVIIAIAGAKFLGFTPGKGGTNDPAAATSDAAADAGAGAGAGAQYVVVTVAHPTENYSPQQPHAQGAGDIVAVSAAVVKSLQDAKVQAELVTPEIGLWEESFTLTRTALQPALAKQSATAVVDIHRDALEGKPEGYCTITVNDEPAAKLLLIVGDLDNPYVDENLAFAQKLQTELEALAPGITRGVKVLHQAVNGDLHPNSVQVHIGEYTDNDTSEAMVTAKLLAQALGKAMQQ